MLRLGLAVQRGDQRDGHCHQLRYQLYGNVQRSDRQGRQQRRGGKRGLPGDSNGFTTATFTDSNDNPISGASVVFRSAIGTATNATTRPDGTAGVTFTPGTYSVTMNYATGYQTKTITVTADGPNAVSFATVAVPAQINDPDSTDLAAVSGSCGNTCPFGPKTPAGSNVQIVFQVLPGTSTFTAYDAGGYQSRAVTVSGPMTVTFATGAVTVTVGKKRQPAAVSYGGVRREQRHLRTRDRRRR